MHCMISVQACYPDQMPIALDAQKEINFRIYDYSTNPRHHTTCVSRSCGCHALCLMDESRRPMLREARAIPVHLLDARIHSFESI
jgi:hypothetical protein